jgi:hypothetical protein
MAMLRCTRDLLPSLAISLSPAPGDPRTRRVGGEVMFCGLRRARAAREAMKPLIENEKAVRGAEEIVRRAWARTLLRRRDHMEFDLLAAREDEDAAHRHLASAQRDGEPGKIATARAALEQAVETTQASLWARDHIRRNLRTELDLLEQATMDYALSRLVRQMEDERSAIVTPGLAVPGTRFPRPESAAATSRSPLRWPRTLRRLVIRRAPQLGRP